MLTFTTCFTFAAGILEQKEFMMLAAMAFTHYFKK